MDHRPCVLSFDDGSWITLTGEKATTPRELLWGLVETQPGALSAAGKIAHARRQMSDSAKRLDAREIAVVRQALQD